MDLSSSSAFFRTLSDSTRVRLLALLEREELTVAELAAITRLAQPRVSTHLAKLKELDLVRDRRSGVSAYYRFNTELSPATSALWRTLCDNTNDSLLNDDQKRMPGVLAKRAQVENWADTVTGDMERHYSPGRTWEALARGMMHLVELGDVLDVASGDGVLAELLSPHAKSITCLDSSERVLNAADKRLKTLKNVRVQQGDMHAINFRDNSFDMVMLMHALTYSEHPAKAMSEAARVLRKGGRLLACTLLKHAHKKSVEPFDHRNLGFSLEDLRKLAKNAKLEVIDCERTTREKRPPHFEIITLLARKV